MFAPLPETAAIQVSPTLASELFEAAESLPQYDNKDFYSLDLQTLVHGRIREASAAGFDSLVEQIRVRIGQRPYCALVSGLRFDEGNRLFVALNRAFGELVARPYEKPRAQLVHYIQPATDLPAASSTSYESEKLHTDTADWDPPVALISMLCVRADRAGGGRSRVLDVDTLREEVRSRLGAKTLELLDTVLIPWQLPPYRGGGVAWRPVLTNSSICWRRYTIDQTVESMQVELPTGFVATLDAFEEVIACTDATLDFLMREGELLFVDNHRTLHARTHFAGGIDSD